MAPHKPCSTVPAAVRVLTIDIEDWFHVLDHPATRHPAGWAGFPSRVEDNTVRILEALAARDLSATFFCLGWVGEHYPQVIRRIVAGGHEIGTHSYGHQLAYEQTHGDFRQDLARSIAVLEEVTGKAVHLYRAPGFSVTSRDPWVFDALIEQGIDIDCSVFPAAHAHGGFAGLAATPSWISRAGGRLREMPVSIGSFLGHDLPYSGGGYFRLMPYALLRQQLERAPYVMSYFHPRDFDPGQPRLEGLSAGRHFKTYVGLNSSWAKFQRLLDEFEFADVAHASQQVDWAAAPVQNL